MKTFFVLATVALGLALAAPGRSQTAPPGEVTLPLAHYLELVKGVEEAEVRAQVAREASRLEVVEHRTAVRIEGHEAAVRTVFEVEARGTLWEPLRLPLGALAQGIRVEPPRGLWVDGAGEAAVALVPETAGTYRVTVEGRRSLREEGGASWLELAPATAPVEETRLDLDAEVAWEAPGAVVVEEEVRDGRRHLRLSFPEVEARRVGIRGRALAEVPDDTLAQVVVVTVLDFAESSSRRLDLVFYEVLRGAVDRFHLTLPSGLLPDRLLTDEGEVSSSGEEGKLEIVRSRRLEKVGFVALSTPLEPNAVTGFSLAPVVPALPVRGRYLVVASQVAQGVEPRPVEAWARVDLSDLPAILATELPALHPGAAWRLADGSASDDLHLAVERARAEPISPGWVRSRETISVLTREGSLVHQDRLTLEGVTGSLRLALPPEATLWSASVDGLEVRPVLRGGELFLPLGFRGAASTSVQVVSLEKRTLASGRGRLSMDLARVDLPVVDHRWRLLLPDTHRFREEEGSLAVVVQGGRQPRSPAVDETSFTIARQERPSGGSYLRGVTVDPSGVPVSGVAVSLRRVAAGSGSGRTTRFSDGAGRFDFGEVGAGSFELISELEGFVSVAYPLSLLPGSTTVVQVPLMTSVQEETIVVAEPVRGYIGELDRLPAERQRQASLRDEMAQLQQGLVGGVKPLPVEVPTDGKLLFLAGALPPEVVGLTLEARSR